MWQQLRKFPVRLNKNLQTNYFRTKNKDKTLKYNIKSDQSLCVGKYSMSCTAYLSRHTTSTKKHNATAKYCIQITWRESFATHLTGIIYSIQQYQRYLYICVCVCVFVCVVIPSILDACLHLSVSVGRASRGHTRVFFSFLGGGPKQKCTKYSSTAAVQAL